MLSPQLVRYAVAVATPRDTHSLAPEVASARPVAPRSLSLPESERSFRASEVWNEPLRREWLASRLAAQRAAAALMARSTRRVGAIEIVPAGEDTRSGARVIARRVAGHTATRTISIPLGLSISVSHADGRAMAAATARPARIGVDLERADRVAPDHADYFLSRHERARTGALTPTELWALKESAWKALGCDDATPFGTLELIFDAGAGIRAVRLGSMVIPVVAEVRHPWPGWVGAIVAFTGVME